MDDCIAWYLAGLLERPVVLEEGQKREKKKVQRLEVTPPLSSVKTKRLSVEEGAGTKLGDIPHIEHQLQKTHADDLRPLHRLLFDKVASVSVASTAINDRIMSNSCSSSSRLLAVVLRK